MGVTSLRLQKLNRIAFESAANHTDNDVRRSRISEDQLERDADIYPQRLSEGLIIQVTHNKWEDGTVFWLPAGSVVSEVALNAFLFLYLMWSNYWLT